MREIDFFYDTYADQREEASLRLMRCKTSEQEFVFKLWSSYPDPAQNSSGVWLDVGTDCHDLINKSTHDFLMKTVGLVVKDNSKSFFREQIFYDQDGVRFAVNREPELMALVNPHRVFFWSGAASSVIGGALIGLAVTGILASTFGLGGIVLAGIGLIVMFMAHIDKTCFKMQLFEDSKKIIDKLFYSGERKPTNLMA